MFLTAEQLAELTDRQQPAAQARWLKAHGWPFVLSADGRPKVAVREVERRMCSPERGRRAGAEPDLDALDRLVS